MIFSRTLALARSDYRLLLCPPKGLFLPGINLDAIYAQLFRFTPCRFRPGLVPKKTQGLQASAKGTTSRVLTRPQPQPIRDLVLFLRPPMTMSIP